MADWAGVWGWALQSDTFADSETRALIEASHRLRDVQV